MKKIIKTSLLLSIIVLSLSTIGCSDIDSQDENNPEINNKEKQERIYKNERRTLQSLHPAAGTAD